MEDNTFSIDAYKEITGHNVIDQLHRLTAPLKGKKMVHVNSTKLGGGVAEILTKMVPLFRSLGIDAHWHVIEGNQDFFQCTKMFHNGLQGNKVLLPTDFEKTINEVITANAAQLKGDLEDADIVVIHDPQPLPLIASFPKRKGKWIWRCHIDASKPYRPVWRYLSQFMGQFDASIFSLPDFTHALPHPSFIIAPSIDPLSEKNRQLEPEEIQAVYSLFNLDPERPILLQVSRFDRFKDHIGVIEAYRLVKKFKPSVQLVLAGGTATDDPEGDMVLNEVKNAAANDPDIHVLLLPDNSHKIVNALQRAAHIVLQKSLKEGFGLTVTEALWKGKPVIGGNTGGIRLQVINWQTGFLVNTPEGAAYHIRYLMEFPETLQQIGARGHEYVKEKFLITRNIRDYLALITSLFHPDEERIEL